MRARGTHIIRVEIDTRSVCFARVIEYILFACKLLYIDNRDSSIVEKPARSR